MLLLRLYPEEDRFTVRTYHKTLKWLLKMSDPSGKLAQWLLRLSELKLNILHRAGVKNLAAVVALRLRTAVSNKKNKTIRYLYKTSAWTHSGPCVASESNSERKKRKAVVNYD